MKKADVTIGPKWVADELGLDFIPLAREKFDFATRKELLRKDAIRDFISLLQSQKFREEASRIGIYASQQTGTLLNK
jgi:Periplasmic molybdate-binding protein/domain